jgi:EAL domain-containing protein (putative c-di-GMP-specific phosphodiesterase class I)
VTFTRRYWTSIARVAQMDRYSDLGFMERLLWEASNVLRADVTFSAAIVRCDDDGCTIEAVHDEDAAGVPMPERGERLPLRAGMLGETLRSGRTSMVPDAALGEARSGNVSGSFVFAPIRVERLWYALVIVAARVPRVPFGEEDRNYVDALARLCAVRLRERRPTSKDDLMRAIAAEDFELYFQPQFHLPSGMLIGAEALIRWNRLGQGTLCAADFIPFAEEHELLGAVGAWVVREAAFAAKKMRAIDPLFRVWFHLSSSELNDARVLRAIDQTGPALHGLGVEIRAHSVVDEDGASCAFMRLKDAGLAVALDNFGGSSSLLRLMSLPVGVVKLDRSLTTALPNGRAEREIVAAVIELGHRLRFETAAEGVESDAQAGWLRNAGCTFAQGHRFGRPMRSEELTALLVARSVRFSEAAPMLVGDRRAQRAAGWKQ